MLIGRDDIISIDIITLGHMFFNVCLHLRSFLHCTDWQKSDSSLDKESHGNWRWNSNSSDVVVSSPSFSHSAARVPWRACLQAMRLQH